VVLVLIILIFILIFIALLFPRFELSKLPLEYILPTLIIASIFIYIMPMIFNDYKLPCVVKTNRTLRSRIGIYRANNQSQRHGLTPTHRLFSIIMRKKRDAPGAAH